MKIIGSSPRATDEICFAVEDFNGNILRHLEETELRVAIWGETGAGKVALLNSLFNTNMFFAIQEKATGVPIEIRHGEKFAVSVLDHEATS